MTASRCRSVCELCVRSLDQCNDFQGAALADDEIGDLPVELGPHGPLRGGGENWPSPVRNAAKDTCGNTWKPGRARWRRWKNSASFAVSSGLRRMRLSHGLRPLRNRNTAGPVGCWRTTAPRDAGGRGILGYSPPRAPASRRRWSSRLLAELKRFLVRDADRELFGLPPLPKQENSNAA